MTRLEREAIAACRDAINALVIYSLNRRQLCFRLHNDIPMGMSRKQERLAKKALDALTALMPHT